jgi:translin
MPTNADWDETLTAIRERAQAMHEARETALGLSRQLVQLSSKCIRHVHRHQYDEATRLLAEAVSAAERARTAIQPFPDMNPAYLHDSEKEMVEAAAVMAIVQDRPLPTPTELGAQTWSYLNGLGEAASEVRRFALDEMRRGEIVTAERILGRMEEIYEDLITFDYPDSMTGSLRRTCDGLRAVVERTRSDLTATASQLELVRELRATRERMSGVAN